METTNKKITNKFDCSLNVLEQQYIEDFIRIEYFWNRS